MIPKIGFQGLLLIIHHNIYTMAQCSVWCATKSFNSTVCTLALFIHSPAASIADIILSMFVAAPRKWMRAQRRLSVRGVAIAVVRRLNGLPDKNPLFLTRPLERARSRYANLATNERTSSVSERTRGVCTLRPGQTGDRCETGKTIMTLATNPLRILIVFLS